jgi:MoaA/NifB/PqqE/SkfB family radical SAM enzyme
LEAPATWNLAVDVVNEQPGLPKALNRIRPNFDYLVKMQHRYGYTVFLNINICRNNLEDVLELTEIGRSSGVATDYHLNEPPMIEQSHFERQNGNSTYLNPEDWPRVDDLLDRLIEKNRMGYKMVNSVQHLDDMKDFLRGRVEPSQCRAGQNSLIIRTDGALAPCFSYYAAQDDWGSVGNPRFDLKKLDELKVTCTRHCLSTCQHTLGYCYSSLRVFKWLLKQAKNRFRGVTGSF